MTIRQEMLHSAKHAVEHLNPNSVKQIVDFVDRCSHPDGGYRGRGSTSDLYYTVFAMKILLALNADLPVERIERYLLSFDSDQTLDLVHLSCLARCWANLPGKEPPSETRKSILDRVLACRVDPTGFANRPGEQKSAIYSVFMALSALQDLGEPFPDREAIIEWMFSQDTADEGFVRNATETTGLTPVTAGALVLLKHLDGEIPKESVQWLLGRHCPEGGFHAASLLPLPDLLSTATALHALDVLNVPIDSIRQPCLQFIDTLWRGEGGFCGMTIDETLDCEYTFYGLLALGTLIE